MHMKIKLKILLAPCFLFVTLTNLFSAKKTAPQVTRTPLARVTFPSLSSPVNRGIVFTGDARADFKTGPNVPHRVAEVRDPGGIGDIPMPTIAPAGTVSGWDIDAVYFYYDDSSDVMYVGFDFGGAESPETICGDADGDGDPGRNSDWLSLFGGQDLPLLSGSETIVLLLDTNNDGDAEVTIGVDQENDLSSFGAYHRDYTGYFFPSYFNDKLSNRVTYHNAPLEPLKDLEFTIEDFSTLPNLNLMPGEPFSFSMMVYAGSTADGSIGDEYVPNPRGGGFPYNDEPAPPTIIRPLSGFHSNSNRPEFSWQVPTDLNEDDVLHFEIEVATDAGFENQITGSPFSSISLATGFNPSPPLLQGQGDCTFELMTELADGEYYWRVSALDHLQFSEYSPAQKFIIDTTIPQINSIEIVNPDFGTNWFNPLSTDSIILNFNYEEKYAKFAELLPGDLGLPIKNYSIFNGNAQNNRFILKTDTSVVDGEYTLTVNVIDSANNQGSESINVFFDQTAPEGTQASSPDTSAQTRFWVTWSGGSDSLGSGLSGIFDIKYRTDGGEWRFWDTNYAGNSAEFTEAFHGHRYSFEVAAWDNLQNREPFTGLAETTTFVDTLQFDKTAPLAPIGVTANGASPSPWQQENQFTIMWTNPRDPSGIARVWYKSGAEPISNQDTTGSVSDTTRMTIHATAEGCQYLWLWLEDGRGNRNYQNRTGVELRTDRTPPQAQIITPISGDTISCITQIRGIASDVNLKTIRFEIGKSGTNSKEQLNTSLLYEQDSFRADWNTMNFNGLYQLFLIVEDEVGLQASDTTSYFIQNPFFEPGNGQTKIQQEFSLFIPPQAYRTSIICLEKLNQDEISYIPQNIRSTGLFCKIHSSIEEEVSEFQVPAILKINYERVNLQEDNKQNLKIFYQNAGNWELIGGTTVQNCQTSVTSITRLGIYGLFEITEPVESPEKGLQLDCQPRMFSPRGGGYGQETQILFNLGKSTDVSVKIYNAAGRRIKVICENQLLTAGKNSLSWNGRDSYENYCVSGIYLVLVETGSESVTRTVMVLNK